MLRVTWRSLYVGSNYMNRYYEERHTESAAESATASATQQDHITSLSFQARIFIAAVVQLTK